MKRVITAAAILMVLTACDSTGPSINSDFPAFYLQNVTTGSLPGSCCFLGGDGDVLAGAGTYLYFVDSEAGYVRAELSLGVPVTHVAGSPDGGYGLAVSGEMLYVVSNDIYTVSTHVVLPGPGRFIIPRPYSNMVFVICTDGGVAAVETSGWTITKVGDTDVTHPVAAAMGTSGDYLFIADEDGTVYKISTADFSTAAQTSIESGVGGMCSTPLGEVFVSPQGASEVWAIDCGTGQHTDTYTVPGIATSLAVTGSGKYLYAAVPGYGLAVVNTIDNEVEAVLDSYGVPVDMEINTQTTRAVLAGSSLFILQR